MIYLSYQYFERFLFYIISLILLTTSSAQGQPGSSIGKKPEAPQKPNVLFISVDDLNDWTGYMGGHPQAKTPNLDRLAKSGVAFMHAYAAAPSCGPSRTALLYGLYPHRTGAYGNTVFYSPRKMRTYSTADGIPEMFRSQKSIPTTFNENGYYTAGAGKIDHFTTREPDPEIEQDFNVYFSPKDNVEPDPANKESFEDLFGPVAAGSTDEMVDTQISDWGIKQLKIKHTKPFFLALGFKKPHLPFVAPQAYFDQFDVSTIQLPKAPADDLKDVPHAGKIFAQSMFGFFTTLPETDNVAKHPKFSERMVRAYLASSSYADAMVGKVLDALKASPYANNTIVVLWGDHGWHLGEKQHWRKFTLWERGTKTPFIIYVPGASSNGQQVNHPVSLIDIYPTLVDLCKLKIDQHLDGNSLAPLLKDPKIKWEKPALMTHGPGNFAVRLDSMRYIRYQNGEEELYNMHKDRGEFNNLAGRPDHKQMMERLQKHVPKNYVTLYDPAFRQFENLDTMKILHSHR